VSLSPDVSVLLVSFNTHDLLRGCLQHLDSELDGLDVEVIVVDNNSRDGSADMAAREFPDVRLIRSPENLGFAGANNLALRNARGKFMVLLNSDAFVCDSGIRRALGYMQSDPGIGAGGGRLVGADGSWQPSIRRFPSPLNDFLIFTGLASRFPNSRFLGRADRRWADDRLPVDTDWVPGAFTIIRKDALDKVGLFDESFFLYFEEVDLCRRLRQVGYRVRYFPDVLVVHLGGESAKEHEGLSVSSGGKQLTLWRLRSQFLYYRKHHGTSAALAMWSELFWHRLRSFRNTLRGPQGVAKAMESRALIAIIEQAWQETNGGRTAPPRPW
jgi:GT2 family glycosyltransferase